MASCELCGSSSDSLKKVKIEGTTLKVCDSCSDMGEEVNTKTKTRKKSRSSSRKRKDQVLVPDYGQKVKEAREDEQLSLRELADELNEKKSLISKIEKEQLKPGKSLAQKISKRFGITLYTNPEVADTGTSHNTDSRKATMEDVADIS